MVNKDTLDMCFFFEALHFLLFGEEVLLWFDATGNFGRRFNFWNVSV